MFENLDITVNKNKLANKTNNLFIQEPPFHLEFQSRIYRKTYIIIFFITKIKI